MKVSPTLAVFITVVCNVVAEIPKIYVYENSELDWSYLSSCYQDANNGLLPELDENEEHAQNMGEVWIHRAMLSHPRRVMDPSVANMFYIPLYITVSSNAMPLAGSLLCKGKTHRQRVEEALDYLEHRSLYFKRLGGADHFLACTWWRCGAAMGNRARVVLSRAVLAINESPPAHNDWAMWECTNRVVTVPYVASSKLTISGMEHHSKTERSIPFYFAGRVRGRPERENMGIIQKSIPESSIGVTSWDWIDGPDVYAKRITDSKFCLCPRGDTQSSRRLFDSIAAGCIPIMTKSQITQGNVPFSNQLAYESFSFVYEDEVFLDENKLLKMAFVLNSIPDDHLVLKRKHLSFAHKALIYSNDTIMSFEEPNVLVKYFISEVRKTMFGEGIWNCERTPWWKRPAEWVSDIPPPPSQARDWAINTEAVVIREHEIFMCTPPFTGSRSIRMFLKDVQEISTWEGKNVVDGLDIIRLQGPEMYDIFARVGWIKAAMVRDPVTRVLTAFTATISTDPIYFKKFVQILFDNKYDIPEVFRPMVRMCGLKHVHFESIITYENSSTDGKIFLESLPNFLWSQSGLHWGENQDMDVFSYVKKHVYKKNDIFELFENCSWVQYFDYDIFFMLKNIYKEDYVAFSWYNIQDWVNKYEKCLAGFVDV